jgi:5S rRNA maturation endonuclease (ribonuclease M5)
MNTALTVPDLLHKHEITLRNYLPGRNYYQTCPKCSVSRMKKSAKCLSVKIDNDSNGATWFCNHCQWKGGIHTSRNEILKSSPEQKFIEELHVKQSRSLLENIIPQPDRECSAEEERAAIIHYEGGLSKVEAELQSGYTKRRLVEELTNLRLLHPFAEILVRLTRPTIFQEWNIGLLKDNTAIFWYQDYKGRFVNGKRLKFKEDGFHKDMANFLYTKEQGFFQCLYGEHQLSPSFTNYLGVRYDKKSRVVLVESEKTAIIMSHHKPEFIWMATSGTNGLTKEKAKILSKRTVLVLFDCDESGKNGADKACRVLSSVGAFPQKVNQFALLHPTKEGFDIADLIYEKIILERIPLV